MTRRDGAATFSVAAMSMLTGLVMATTASAEQAHRGKAITCLVEVLNSEEVPVGPEFYHTYRETLRVTPTGGMPFVTRIQRATPWQMPPPRPGQRQKVPCDSELLESSFRWF